MSHIKIKLKSGQTLSDYKDDHYDFKKNGLPTGIIDKKYTGIGATHCEIVSKRNSIIVSPTRSLARSKFEEWVKKEKEIGISCFYLGGGFGKIKDEDIKNFLGKEGIKKVFAVANSFPRIVEIGGDKIYKEFALVVDEIDSFQVDSSYRSSLESTVDYFWEFDNKAVVTATLIDFSDKRFNPSKDFPLFQVEITDFKKRRLNLYSIEDPVLGLVNLINQIQVENRDKKIFVALNSMTQIKRVIKTLVNEKLYDLQDFGILCSEKSEISIPQGVEKIELNEGLLSRKINFATSAYFVGIDILEPVHLIACNSDRKHYSILFPEKILQIIGRCRREVYSLNLITFPQLTNPFIKKFFPFVKRERLVEKLQPYKETFENIRQNFQGHPEEEVNKIELKIIEIEINGIRGLFRRNSLGNLALSDFTVDYSVYNSNRIREYSYGLSGLINYLNNYFEVVEPKLHLNQFLDLSKLVSEDFVNSFLSNYKSKIYRSSEDYLDNKNFSLICLHQAELNIENPKISSFLLQVIYFGHLWGDDLIEEKIKKYNKKAIQIKPFARKIKLFKLINSRFFEKEIVYEFEEGKEYLVGDLVLKFLKIRKKYKDELTDLITDDILSSAQLFSKFLESIFEVKKRRIGKKKETVYKIISLKSKEFISIKKDKSKSYRNEVLDKIFMVEDKSILLSISDRLLNSMIN